ncbi:MAG: TolC family protein [Campylobacterota bacterium]
MKQILVLAFPFLLFAQTLEELIDLAQNNKNIQAMQQQQQALQQEYESAQSGYLPQINIGASYATAKEETAATPKKSASAYVEATYSLYDGGKKDDLYSSYEQNIKASQKSTQAQKDATALEVIRHYFNYNSLLGQKEATQQQIKQLQAQKKRITSMLEAGTATQDELQKIISNVQSAKLNLHQIELDMQTILHNLGYLTGRKVTIDSGSAIAYANPKSADRADIQAMQLQSKAARYEAQMEKSGYMPQLTLENRFSYYENDYDNAAYESDYDSQNILSLNLRWNIFDFGQTQKSYEAKHKRYLASKLQTRYQKQKADTDLALAKRGYAIAKLQIDSAKEGLKAAREAYDVIKSKYENGLVNNVSYLQALSEQVQAQSSLQSALNAFEIKKALLLYHGGKPMKEYIQ